MEVAGVESVVQVTEAHARKYRDHLLDSVQASTTKTRLRYVKELFEVAEEEDWIERNPFNAIKLKRIKAKSKPKEVKCWMKPTNSSTNCLTINSCYIG